jgi:dTDP-glucose 4,6-dehydratase
MTHAPEDYAESRDTLPPTSAYGKGKREAEQLCIDANSRTGIHVKIARCFAFVGPHLPLDRHFAIGNFLRDALAGRPIAVRDGRPFRSYMYAADLAVWLWTILARGACCRPYNVGSDHAVSIADVAPHVAGLIGTSVEIQITDANPRTATASYYVPDTKRARSELGLTCDVDLTDAIERTFTWYSQRLNSLSLWERAGVRVP